MENLLFPFCSVPPLTQWYPKLQKRAVSFSSGFQEGEDCSPQYPVSTLPSPSPFASGQQGPVRGRDAFSRAPCPAMEPGECRTTHSDPTSRRTAFRVGPLCSTSLPHRGYVGNSPGPACTVPGGLAELPRPSRWLLRTIRLGYAIQFARLPPKFRGIRFTSVLNNDAPVLRAEVAVLLAKDAIEPVPPAEMKSGFYSPYFIVPKKGSGLRPILDLRVLNRALHKLPFRMLTQRRIFQCVRPFDLICSDRPEGCLLPCLDPPSTQTVLRFAFEGRAYQCKALPFGLSLLSLEHCCANTGIWFLVTSAGWGFRSTGERANSPLRRGSLFSTRSWTRSTSQHVSQRSMLSQC